MSVSSKTILLKGSLKAMLGHCEELETATCEAESYLTEWAQDNKQSDLARAAGISVQYLNDLVNCKRRLNASVAEKLLGAL